MARAFAEIAFTPSVRAAQHDHGSDEAYLQLLQQSAPAHDRLREREARFIAERDGFYQATVSSSGWPYVQFRGGPAGFVRVLDERTLAYADYRGNRQYISAGNLTDDGRIALIFMDYANRRRLKLWGRAALTEARADPALVSRLHVHDCDATPERAVIITVAAFDWNCPQHIPRRLTLEEIRSDIDPLREELARLSEDNRRLRALVERADGV